MIKLPATTKYIRVRHFRVRLSATQIMKFDRNLTVENELHNYALKYLEKTYGRKHLSRPYPSTATEKRYVVKDHILPGFRQEKYGLTKWNAKTIGLHSQAAREFLVTMMTNFGEYRKTLKQANKMIVSEKEAYRNNEQGNNTQHRSWYRKGSLNYLRNGASHKTVSLPSNGQFAIVAPHHIKIQDYGVVQTAENLSCLRGRKITVTKLKCKGDGTFDLQLVLTSEQKRVAPTRKVGADWNMKDNKILHTSDDEKIYLDSRASILADYYEELINRWKSQRDRQSAWLNPSSQRLRRLNDKIRHYNAKRSNLLTENYRQIANSIFDDYDLIAIEKLSAKEMRREQKALGVAGNRSKNRNLAKIKPYEFSKWLAQVANREGKTLLKVDSYKTSQVEFGTQYQEKHDLSIREWTSKFTGRHIDRDLNASRNILTWSLDPKKHIKYLERQAAIKQAKADKLPEDKQPKPIKPSYLVEVN